MKIHCFGQSLVIHFLCFSMYQYVVHVDLCPLSSYQSLCHFPLKDFCSLNIPNGKRQKAYLSNGVMNLVVEYGRTRLPHYFLNSGQDILFSFHCTVQPSTSPTLFERHTCSHCPFLWHLLHLNQIQLVVSVGSLVSNVLNCLYFIKWILVVLSSSGFRLGPVCKQSFGEWHPGAYEEASNTTLSLMVECSLFTTALCGR